MLQSAHLIICLDAANAKPLRMGCSTLALLKLLMCILLNLFDHVSVLSNDDTDTGPGDRDVHKARDATACLHSDTKFLIFDIN
jgi:hypothetical protein